MTLFVKQQKQHQKQHNIKNDEDESNKDVWKLSTSSNNNTSSDITFTTSNTICIDSWDDGNTNISKLHHDDHNSTCEENDDNNGDIDKIDDSKCMQIHPVETIELIRTSLKQFQLCLNEKIQAISSTSSLTSSSKRTTCKSTKSSYESYRLACTNNPKWAVHDQSFRLQFLRTEVFHIELAVERFLLFWEHRTSLFHTKNAFCTTETKTKDEVEDDVVELERLVYMPTIQATMSVADRTALQYGYVQNVKGHSRLLYYNPANTPPKYTSNDIDSIARAIHYTILTKVSTSLVAQQKGVVSIVDFQTIRTFDHTLVKRISSTINDGFPVRTTMCCIINAPIGTGTFISMMKVFLKPKLRNRIHVINRSEQLYTLLGVHFHELNNKQHHIEWLEQMKQREEKKLFTKAKLNKEIMIADGIE